MRQLDALNDAAQNEAGAAGVFMGANAGQMLSSDMSEPLRQSTSVEERLIHLKKLFESELITKEEYEKKKHSILEEL